MTEIAQDMALYPGRMENLPENLPEPYRQGEKGRVRGRKLDQEKGRNLDKLSSVNLLPWRRLFSPGSSPGIFKWIIDVIYRVGFSIHNGTLNRLKNKLFIVFGLVSL